MPNTVNEWLTTAKAIDPERVAKWLRIYGTDEIPITCPIPLSRASFPGIGEQDYYQLDLKAITPEMKERVIASIALEFNLPIEQVRQSIDEIGVPVLANGVMTTCRDSGLLFSLIDDGSDPSGEYDLEEADGWGDDKEYF